jgi:DNA polymerase I-like protein with 3'-5' exonuclease and polymerase domains
MKIFVDSDEKVQEALDLLTYTGYLKLDTETTGFDPYTDKLWCVQIGDADHDILFPWIALSDDSKAKVVEYVNGKTVVAHNAKFDIKFLLMNGFDIRTCWCTQEIERILYAGKYFTFGLKDLMKRRFQVEMDKTVREIFYSSDKSKPPVFQLMVEEMGVWGAWTDEVINYALEDIEPLLDIREQQERECAQTGSTNVAWLENNLAVKTAYMELRGVAMDGERVAKFEDLMILKRDTMKVELDNELASAFERAWHREYTRRMTKYNAWKLAHKEIVAMTSSMRDPLDKRRKTAEALKMTEDSLKKCPYSSEPNQNVVFNPKSHDHMKMALSEITGINITSTNKDWLEENSDIHPSIGNLMEFRKYEKLAQFATIMDEVNPVTGRIHANFWQNGTKTGRYSCSSPNLQQIPARSKEGKEFRTMFIAPKGYKMVGADFEGIELVILAVLAGEQMLIEAINSGKDVHCFTMSKFLGCPYETVKKAKDFEDTKIELSESESNDLLSARELFDGRFALPELQKIESIYDWVKKLRDYTKTLTYGVVYGLSPFGLSAKFHCDFDEAKEFIKLIFGTTYSNIKVYLQESGQKGLRDGWNATKLGRRRWFTKPRKETYEEVESKVTKALKKEKRAWESIDDFEWEAIMADALEQSEKEYKSKLNAIHRMSANSAIQGLSADITKLSMHLFEETFNGGLDEGLILTVHDELWALVREENAERAKEVLEHSMKRAGNKFLADVRIGAEAKITDYWEK